MLAVNVSIEREESLVFFAAAAGTREARKRAPAPSDGALPGLPASPSGAGRRHRRFAGKAPDEVFKRFIFTRKSFSAAQGSDAARLSGVDQESLFLLSLVLPHTFLE